MPNDVLTATGSPIIETAAGKLRGASATACGLQGHSLRRADRRRQPLHAAATARDMGRRARRDRLSRPCAATAGPARAAPGTAHDPRPGRRHPGERGLPDPQRLDARHRRRREAAGDGLAAWRRLRLRLGQPRGHRRRQPGAARRCRRGQRQPPPQHLRLSAPRRSRRRALRAFRQCRHARPGRGARMGARQHRGVRRRSRQRDDLRRVGRRREGQRPAGDAGGARACSIAPLSRAARRSGSRPASAATR